MEQAPVTIHIIEDDLGVRDALTELALELGYSVRAYGDGESFIRVEPPGPDDTVLVDLGLPGIGGDKVIGWLKTLRQPPRMIIISGRSRGDLDHALRGLSDVPLLRKPLAPEAITALL